MQFRALRYLLRVRAGLLSNGKLRTISAPQAAILFDKFHVLRHLGKALDTIRKREYGRLQGKPRINKIRVLQRRAYGLRDEEYLR
jgi:transposase